MNTLLTGLTLFLAPLAGDELDFAALAAELLERAHVAETQPGDETVAAVFASASFHRVPLGLLEVVFPVEAAERKQDAATLSGLAAQLCDLQAHWLEWSARDADEAREARQQLEVLGKWASNWSERKLAKAPRAPGSTLFERLAAPAEVLAARERLERILEARREDAGRGEDYRRTRLVLAPTRRQYLEVAAFLGWAEAERRPVLWHESTVYGKACWGKTTQVVPLENAAWPFGIDTAFVGDPISGSKTILAQHVLDRASTSLLMLEFFFASPPLIETALGTGLVIATCGENDVTSEVSSTLWTRQGGSTQAYSRFVPGGNSNGGTLPKRLAKAGPTTYYGDTPSGWRKTFGKDWFVKPLRAGQKAGAKLAAKRKDLDAHLRDDKRLHFALERSVGGSGEIVTAPFLGAAADEKPIPPLEVLDDYEEFFRAYRACFLFWLRTEAPPDTEEPPAAFARWVRRLLAAGETTPETAAREIYGLPLGSEEGPSLENHFLDWLSRQR